jgi:hypothetical protein
MGARSPLRAIPSEEEMDAPIAPVMPPPAAAPRRQLPSTQRVEPSTAAPKVADRAPSFASQNATAAESRLLAQRTVERDEATNSLVFRLIDVTTGSVTAQTPSEARLKIRAYIDGLVARMDGRGTFEATA